MAHPCREVVFVVEAAMERWRRAEEAQYLSCVGVGGAGGGDETTRGTWWLIPVVS